MTGNPSRFAAAELAGWVTAALRSAGADPDDADFTARALVRSDLRGIGTHGVSRIPSYLEKLSSGEVTARPRPSVTEHDGVLRVDGDGGLGQAVGARAVRAAVDAAHETSVVSCVITRSGHLGALGVLALVAAEEGMIALLCAQTPAFMSLPGSRDRALGNNPIAFAAPVRDRDPLVFDISTSTTARGRILAAAREGSAIPEGWAIGPDGEPTTDAETALHGSMLPMSGHKGIGLAMMIEVLAGSLGGSAAPVAHGGESAVGETGAFLLVINPERMLGRAQFDAQMTAWLARYLEASGPDARYPGARAAASERERLNHGIPLSDTVTEELTAAGRLIGVPFIAVPLPR